MDKLNVSDSLDSKGQVSIPRTHHNKHSQGLKLVLHPATIFSITTKELTICFPF